MSSSFICRSRDCYNLVPLLYNIKETKRLINKYICIIIISDDGKNEVDILVENSELMKQILTTLLSISGRKTTPRHAVYVMESTIENLKKQYSFLNDVGVKDTTFVEEGEQVTVMMNVNDVSKNEFGSALKEILQNITENLGKEAGHFFFKEISQKLSEESISTMSDFGIDLGLMQLEQTVSKMESRLLK